MKARTLLLLGTWALCAGPSQAEAARRTARPVREVVARPVAEPAGQDAKSGTDAQAGADAKAGLARRGDEARPWANGVPEQSQLAAAALFKEGNALLKDSVFVQAAAKYREALKHWNHPGIHYNLTLALLNLDQPLEVLDHVLQAMKYGPEPIDDDKFAQAKRYKLLIEKQLAWVVVTCTEPGAQVVMDGRALFTAPGKYESFVRSGPHTIVASKEGFLTNTLNKALPAGEQTTVEVKLFAATDLTQYRRRWGNWLPWSVIGAGVALAAGGGGLHLSGAQDIRTFDAGIEKCAGCIPSYELVDTRNSGESMQKLAMGTYGAAGAVLATGAVLLYMNRLQPYQVTAEDLQQQAEGGGQALLFSPFLGRDSQGMQALVRW